MELVLYTRPDCHLCDQALALVREAGLEPRRMEIDGDLALLRAYGTRIPVLRRQDTGAELCWPFDRERLEEFAE